jgi:hypothetical protein
MAPAFFSSSRATELSAKVSYLLRSAVREAIEVGDGHRLLEPGEVVVSADFILDLRAAFR